ncbi:MAG: nucleotidyltransferase domain-containing protein [Anaerolineaceae bacterium]|nr:nucleotidyltransferase domain-containing protein [Anaerolineaceae bacterium]
MTLIRETILDAVQTTLQPLDYVHAMWQGGAAAFNRADEWSDIDLMIIADGDHVADTVTALETALQSLSPIDIRNELPTPTWHGHWQTFYRLRDTSPFLFIDCVVLKRSNPNRFLETELHGQAVVHFDKGDFTQPPPFSVENHIELLKKRFEAVKVMFNLFHYVMTQKELNRGNSMDALAYYHAFTLRPLVEVLRMQHDPARYNFYIRYAKYDLPPEVVVRLEPLFFVTDAADLATKLTQAGELFTEACAQVDFDAIRHKLTGKK